MREVLGEARRAGVEDAVRSLLDRILAFGPVPAGYGLTVRAGAEVQVVATVVAGPQLWLGWSDEVPEYERHPG